MTKRFPDGYEAVKEMDLEVRDGEFMILVGPSGCGKSTALRMNRRAGGQVCELELGYVDVSTLATETVTIPINVNVVPGDEAAGRVPNPTVRSEVAFQSAQRAKREAAEAMRQGRPDQARGIRLQAAKTLDQHAPASAPEMRDEIQAEASMMRDLAQRAEYDDQAASRS